MKKIFFRAMVLGLVTVASPLAYAADAASKTDEMIDSAAEKLKEVLNASGEKIEEAQKYLQEYDWQGLVPKPYSGAVGISGATFNGKYVACVVKPGERIEGEVVVVVDKEKSQGLKDHRLIIGFKNIGAQTSFSVKPFVADQVQREKFTLVAPMDPGLYQVRFRSVQSPTEAEALKLWNDEQGLAPAATSTIGFIWVKA